MPLKISSADLAAKAKRWGPAAVWMLIIFQASSDSASVAHSSHILSPFCLWLFPHITLAQFETVQLIVRKAAHMTEYALLAILLLRALAYERGDARKWISSAWVLSVAYAASDEFHQSFVPQRNPSVVDVFIDAAGAALGLLCCYLVLRTQEKKAPRQEKKLPQGAKPAAAAQPPQRPSFADQLLCTLQGEDFENRSQVRLAVQDRLQRENGGRLILGRNSAVAQLHIGNTSVSSQHFSLLFRNGQFEIEDLDSSNGTRVNGRRLVPFQPVVIADGDRIEAGEVLLHFRRLG